ncbi:MAG TPA: hypothetical protein VHY20_08770 [Pirellulales bacterium]|nr:hypothetical protein [Pirellulales bacterium]
MAALASCHGPLLFLPGEPVSADALHRYWAASKCRMDRWSRSLKTADRGPQRSATQIGSLYCVVEEILASEVLTRVWTAVLAGHDRLMGRQEAEIIALSVFSAHLEARRRSLKLLVEGPGIDAYESLQLNRLRRRAERWSDLLVGHLAIDADVSEFAVLPERARQFAADLKASGGGTNEVAWRLTMASLRAAFRYGLTCHAPNADSNTQIAAAIMGCFPSECFHSTGLFPNAWTVRLLGNAVDAQVRIDELFAEEQPATRPGFVAEAAKSPPGRPRFSS